MTLLNVLSLKPQNMGVAEYNPTSFGEISKSGVYSGFYNSLILVGKNNDKSGLYKERDNILSSRFTPDQLNQFTGSDNDLKKIALDEELQKGLPLPANYTPNIEKAKIKKIDEAIIAGRKTNPEQWQDIKTSDEIEQQIIQRGRASQDLFAENVAKAESSFAKYGGLIVGAIGGAFTDPINIATMPFGATSSVSILKAMKTEALLNAAIEAAETPFIADWQRKMGYKYGVGEAAFDIATAGVGAAALTGVIRGARPASEALNKIAGKGIKFSKEKSLPILQRIGDNEKLPTNVREAAKYMSRVAHIDEEAPSRVMPNGEIKTDISPKDIAEHRANLQETQDAFNAGREVNYKIDAETQKFLDEYFGKNLIIDKSPIYNLEIKKRDIELELNDFDLNKQNRFEEILRDNNYPVNTIKSYEENLKNILLQRSVERENVNPGKTGKRIRLFDEETANIEQNLKDEIKSIKSLNDNGRIQQATEQLRKERQKIVSDLNKINKQLLSQSKIEKPNKIKDLEKTINQPKTINEQQNTPITTQKSDFSILEKDLELLDKIPDAYDAEFTRLLKDNPDMEIEIEGQKFTIKDIAEQMKEDDNLLSAIKTCTIRK